MPSAFGLGCDCCECPTDVCVRVICPDGMGIPVSGATIEIREAADPVGSGALIDSGTTDAFGNFCTTVTEAVDVDIVVSKTGYHGKTLGPLAATCETGLTVKVELCLVQTDISVHVSDCIGCPLEGAYVEITGDVTGSGATGADGIATIAVNLSEECASDLTIDLVITPPSGRTDLGSRTILGWPLFECLENQIIVGIALPVATGCCCYGGHGGPMTWHYSDAYVSLDIITCGSGSGINSYTSSCSVILCGPYNISCVKGTADVDVSIVIGIQTLPFTYDDCPPMVRLSVERRRGVIATPKDCPPDTYELEPAWASPDSCPVGAHGSVIEGYTVDLPASSFPAFNLSASYTSRTYPTYPGLPGVPGRPPLPLLPECDLDQTFTLTGSCPP